MTVAPGVRLGVYQVSAPLGAGGMGEVWRARDTRLQRDVALKLLPAAFAHDPERVARFRREAEVLASLNHPNIAAIYGLDETDGTTALVMELVEGPTLADRIAGGPVPVEEALPIATQVAEALEAAHEAGVVHRDLKPANIKLRPDGTVKVLDFGLAKVLEPTPGSVTGASQSPTITSPAQTRQGVILGTAAYMSPEQARGKPVDKRADIWAFGCVLFEMLSGRRAFEEEDVSLTLSNVLQREPEFAALPAAVPGTVRQALKVCLVKDPKRRAGDIRDVRLAMEGAFETAASVPGREVSTGTWRLAVPVALAASLLGLAIGRALWDPPAGVEPQVTRLRLSLPVDVNLTPGLAISSDGRTVAYGTRSTSGRSALMIHPLDALDATELHGEPLAGGDARFGSPFFSPDGASVGFQDRREGAIKQVSVTGGPARTIVSLGTLLSTVPRAAWRAQDDVLYGGLGSGGLWRVVDGGPPERLTTIDEARGEVVHAFPEPVPDRDAVLFVVGYGEGLEAAEIVALDLESRARHVVVAGGRPPFRYVATGHLVYTSRDRLWAAPFDHERLQVTGAAVPVLEAVGRIDDFHIARNGTLVYRTSTAPRDVTMVWMDPAGLEAPLDGLPAGRYASPRISPDGTRVAVRSVREDIWVWDQGRGTLAQVTSDPAADRSPLWSPDGSRIAFESLREGGGVYWKRADGTGAAERLLGEPFASPFAWSPAGDLLFNGTQGRSIGLLRMAGEPAPEILLDTASVERRPALSPDGRWLAYQASEAGRWVIYVRPFPEVTRGRWLVSTSGGEEPVWSPDGNTLFYIDHATGRLMSVPVETADGFRAGTPKALFDINRFDFNLANHSNYDIGPDGRFLFVKPVSAPDGGASEIVVVLNWLEQLTRLVPPE